MRLELNITFRCQLKCRSCNRLCNLTRLDDPMTVAQIEMLVARIAAEKKHVKRIKLVGGEPTIHPEFWRICEVLSEGHKAGWIDKINVNTNCVTQRQFVDKPLPVGCHWQLSPPSKKQHRPCLWSPIDLGLESKGPCKMVRVCGFSLDVKGWLPCSAAIAIARLFGMEDLYRPLDGPLPTKAWGMSTLCPNCLFGVDEQSIKGRKFREMPISWDRASPRWDKAIQKYFQEHPECSLIS